MLSFGDFNLQFLPSLSGIPLSSGFCFLIFIHLQWIMLLSVNQVKTWNTSFLMSYLFQPSYKMESVTFPGHQHCL